jgi:hypothetical protein
MPVRGVPFDEAGREEFAKRPLIAVYGVTAPDGSLHLTPVWYFYRDGAFRSLVDRGSAKHRYSEAAGRAAICLNSESGGQFQYVTAQGPVEVVHTVPIEYRRELWAHYLGAERAGQVVRNSRHERQVALILKAERWITRSQVETDELEEAFIFGGDRSEAARREGGG